MHDNGDGVDLGRGDHLAQSSIVSRAPQTRRPASALSPGSCRPPSARNPSSPAMPAGARADQVPVTQASINPSRIFSGISPPPRESRIVAPGTLRAVGGVRRPIASHSGLAHSTMDRDLLRDWRRHKMDRGDVKRLTLIRQSAGYTRSRSRFGLR
jgi:hypothetical protein